MRTVWLRPDSGSPKKWNAATTQREGEELQEWTDIGEFETSCRSCGLLIEPVVFLMNEAARKRWLHRGEHECPGLAAEREQRGLAVHLAYLDQPDRTTERLIQRDTHLPGKFFAGLHRLTRTASNAAALDAAAEMVDRFQGGERGRGLYLWGAEGTGKSAISKALAFDLRHRTGNQTPAGWSRPVVHWGPRAVVQWWDVQELFAAMFRSWNGELTEYNEQHISEADCLLLDDWGKEGPSDFKWRDLFRRINGFYNDGRALVFTCQYAPDEQLARMSEAIGELWDEDLIALFARIGETCEVVELTGASWRQAAARRRK